MIEEPGGYSSWSHKESDTTSSCMSAHTHTPVVLGHSGLQLGLTSVAPLVPRPWIWTETTPLALLTDSKSWDVSAFKIYERLRLKQIFFTLSIYSLSYHKKGHSKECSREPK